jgi:hypothetical protein
MRSRARQRAFIQDNFHLDALPMHYHEDVVTTICALLQEADMRRIELCRLLFTDPRCAFFLDFPQVQLAAFLGVSPALISQCKREAQ